VKINLYACAAAQGEASFAERLTGALAHDATNPHDVETFGHTEYGNTATITAGRQLHAQAGAAAIDSTSNWHFFFDEAYLDAQARAIGARLERAASDVLRVMRRDEVAVAWLVNRHGAQGSTHDTAALTRVFVTMPSGQRLLASFAVGLEPALTLAAVRAQWERDDEGLALLRHHLDAGARCAHRGRAAY
jgi:hypothetical protein